MLSLWIWLHVASILPLKRPPDWMKHSEWGSFSSAISAASAIFSTVHAEKAEQYHRVKALAFSVMLIWEKKLINKAQLTFQIQYAGLVTVGCHTDPFLACSSKAWLCSIDWDPALFITHMCDFSIMKLMLCTLGLVIITATAFFSVFFFFSTYIWSSSLKLLWLAFQKETLTNKAKFAVAAVELQINVSGLISNRSCSSNFIDLVSVSHTVILPLATQWHL